MFDISGADIGIIFGDCAVEEIFDGSEIECGSAFCEDCHYGEYWI